MILGQVPWYNAENIDDIFMLENCDTIVIFLIYDQFGAIQKPDPERIVCKTQTYINSNLLFYKSWKQN